jgi:hypothetical protein
MRADVGKWDVALQGKAILINWSNVPEEARSRYLAWHDREHMEGRLRLPGFRRGRRLWATSADRDVLNLYEVDDVSALTGPAYSAKSGSPSPVYRDIGKTITEAIRAISHVRYSRGTALGGWMMTIRWDALGQPDVPTQALTGLLDRCLALDGILGVHVCVTDRPSSEVVTADRQGRPTAVPGWAILIEATMPLALEQCRATVLDDDALFAAGCPGPFRVGTYALQLVMTKQDIEDPGTFDEGVRRNEGGGC